MYQKPTTNLDLGVMGDGRFTVGSRRDNDLEGAELTLLHRMGVSAPVVYASG